MKTTKAILINPAKHEVTEIDLPSNDMLPAMYRHIGNDCDLVERVRLYDETGEQRSDIEAWVDEEAHMRQAMRNVGGVWLSSYRFHPLAGRIIITGTADSEGDILPCPMSAGQVRSQEVLHWVHAAIPTATE